MKAYRLALVALPLLAFGCANKDAPDVEDSQTGWRSTSSAMDSSRAELSIHVEDGQVTIDATCPEGGMLSYDGSWGGEDDFALEVLFDDCGSRGVVTNGDLQYSANVVAMTEDGVSSGRVELTYDGMLTWTGDVEGECIIDATLVAEASAGDGMASASIEARGTMCGHDADAVASASAG